MKILFISRKKSTGVGGLSRFTHELVSHFPQSNYLLSPGSLFVIFRLPFLKFDLIHLCDATLLPLGFILKLVFNKPLTLTAHGLDLTFTNPIYQFMLKILLPKMDAIVLDSVPAKRLLSPFEVSQKQIWVIHPGISIKYFSTIESIQLPNIEQKIVILTVGNLVLRKGHVWFIKNVFKKLPKEFVYLIVGENPQKLIIEQVIRKNKLEDRVFLLGRLIDSKLSFIFKKADIYVCPNQKIKGDFEGFGIAVGEAAAMGLPVVTSNVDGITEVIKDGKNGYLVKPEPSIFIKTIKLLKNGQLRKNMGLKAKRYTRTHYAWPKTAQKYLSVFQQVTGRN